MVSLLAYFAYLPVSPLRMSCSCSPLPLTFPPGISISSQSQCQETTLALPAYPKQSTVSSEFSITWHRILHCYHFVLLWLCSLP
ncbi:hypothetical protein F4824DRAFT_456104 [Ustulina deusta]|nr:hypothetical protein F4824DRAFT_456104 [Ustulina deusta]